MSTENCILLTIGNCTLLRRASGPLLHSAPLLKSLTSSISRIPVTTITVTRKSPKLLFTWLTAGKDSFLFGRKPPNDHIVMWATRPSPPKNKRGMAHASLEKIAYRPNSSRGTRRSNRLGKKPMYAETAARRAMSDASSLNDEVGALLPLDRPLLRARIRSQIALVPHFHTPIMAATVRPLVTATGQYAQGSGTGYPFSSETVRRQILKLIEVVPARRPLDSSWWRGRPRARRGATEGRLMLLPGSTCRRPTDSP